MVYDAVLCVNTKHNDIALKALKSLQLFSQSRKIFVITSQQNFSFFEQRRETGVPVYLLDEDQLIKNISLGVIQELLDQRVGPHARDRAGWYLQQFLKMSICNLSEVADHYLVWDSDTILLQPLEFFGEDGTVLINPKTEHHIPYFELAQKVLGIEKQVDFSFITEHLMIRKSFMKELINSFMAKAPDKTSWVELIMNSIDNKHLAGSGFSEFETYGNFVVHKYGNSFKCRPLKSIRSCAKIYGMTPTRYDILDLMLAGYVFATFETWHPSPTKIQRAMSRIATMVRLMHYRVTNRCSRHLRTAVELCQ